jgi:hypothetical protein
MIVALDLLSGLAEGLNANIGKALSYYKCPITSWCISKILMKVLPGLVRRLII